MKTFLIFAGAILTAAFISSCFGDKEPVITLTALDCPKDSVILTLTVSKRGGSPNYFTDVSLNVKCNTRPIPNAEVKAETAWGTFKWVTDQAGNIRQNSGPRAGDPSGSKVKITIEGSDGSKEVEKTVP